MNIVSKKNFFFNYYLQKACSVVGYTNFQPQSLVLYKYANVISNMDYQHHLYPIMCQKFFTLYLTRIPYNEDERRFVNTLKKKKNLIWLTVFLSLRKIKLDGSHLLNFYIDFNIIKVFLNIIIKLINKKKFLVHFFILDFNTFMELPINFMNII